MRCPMCSTEDTRVIDSRPAEEGTAIRRRRECVVCGERFTTSRNRTPSWKPVIPEAFALASGGREETFLRPAKTRNQTETAFLGDLMDRVFRGSPGNLVLQALSTRKVSSEEREKIRELLDRLEKESSE